MVQCTRREALFALGSLAFLGPLAMQSSSRDEAFPQAQQDPAEPFTLVALPDTQFYSRDFPDLFMSQTRWIVENRARLNILFVSHLGDITDSGYDDRQWENALAALNLLDGQVPFGVTPGNHDLYLNEKEEAPNSSFVRHLGPRSRFFHNKPWYGGASPSGFSSWQKIKAGGRDIIFLNLDDNAMGEEAVWAQRVLDAHPATPAILVTHDYLLPEGRRRHPYFPDPRRNTGEWLWQSIVRSNPQIFMVLCGHIHGQGSQISHNDAGLEVFELLADYQMLDNGGNGFLRVLSFDPTAGVIKVRTWSPSLGRNLSDADTPGDGAFTLHLDFTRRFAPLERLRLTSRLQSPGAENVNRDRTSRIVRDQVALGDAPALVNPNRFLG